MTGDETPSPDAPAPDPGVPVATVAREWLRIGCIGFGGPPAHIALLRRLCVEARMDHPPRLRGRHRGDQPAPGSRIDAARDLLRLARRRCPRRDRRRRSRSSARGSSLILVLASVFLSHHPPLGVLGAASGAGAAVPAVALSRGTRAPADELGEDRRRRVRRVRWILFFAVGALAAATDRAYLVLVIAASGSIELLARRRGGGHRRRAARSWSGSAASQPLAVGGLGAPSRGSPSRSARSPTAAGFVIVPLMQHDAVSLYHWMTPAQFLDAVALGQITPGPVVQTVAVVGYAAAGIGGGLLAALVAFAPSFAFVLVGRPPLRPAPRQPRRPDRSYGRRSRRDRCDRRLRPPARPRPRPPLAAAGARRRRPVAARCAPWRGQLPARGGSRRGGRRPGGGAGGKLSRDAQEIPARRSAPVTTAARPASPVAFGWSG